MKKPSEYASSLREWTSAKDQLNQFLSCQIDSSGWINIDAKGESFAEYDRLAAAEETADRKYHVALQTLDALSRSS